MSRFRLRMNSTENYVVCCSTVNIYVCGIRIVGRIDILLQIPLGMEMNYSPTIAKIE